MKFKLNEIADIQIGYQPREKVLSDREGTHRLIQIKDLDLADEHDDQFTAGTPRLWLGDLDPVTPRAGAERYRIEPGDVLFAARGVGNVAVPLVEGHVQPYPASWDEVIPAYTFYIVRPRDDRLQAEYLAWYINQPPAQAYIRGQSRGTLAKLLPKGIFGELDILVPPVKVQRKIVELDQLRAREEHYMHQLIEARRRLVQQLCLDLVTGKTQK